MLGHLACWDEISFDNVQQVTLGTTAIALPVLSQLEKADIDAYLA